LRTRVAGGRPLLFSAPAHEYHDGHNPTNGVCSPTRYFIAMDKQLFQAYPKANLAASAAPAAHRIHPHQGKVGRAHLANYLSPIMAEKLELANSADVTKVFRLHWEVQMLFGFRSFAKIASN